MRRERVMDAIEWVTAKIGVGLDCHRPLRGPLARPAWWLADLLVDLSWWAYHDGGPCPDGGVFWHNVGRSHRRQPGWGYVHGLQAGGKGR